MFDELPSLARQSVLHQERYSETRIRLWRPDRDRFDAALNHGDMYVRNMRLPG